MTDVIDQMQDIDSHEMIPTHFFADVFGVAGSELATLLERQDSIASFGEAGMVHPGTQDVLEVTPDSVWNVKGVRAPSAIDLTRRAAVLDEMGIKSQLVFPTFGLAGAVIFGSSPEIFEFFFGGKSDVDRKALGRRIILAHNDWAVGGRGVDTERVRVVAILPTEDLDEMMSESTRLIDAGARALWISAAMAPGGVSPASPELDDFWAQAEVRDVPIVLHIGTEFGFLDSSWRKGAANFVSESHSLEAPLLDVYTLSTIHYAVENFLATMVLGGVFERHPKLRFGVIECMASWIGPLARRMDMIVGVMKGEKSNLSMKPSEYLARNVRVSPFWFEPIDDYIRMYPELVEVYTYSSDYPHIEGGRHSKRTYYDKIAPLGDDVVQKFFRTNGDLLLPAGA